jgi:hypothetical protein
MCVLPTKIKYDCPFSAKSPKKKYDCPFSAKSPKKNYVGISERHLVFFRKFSKESIIQGNMTLLA